MPVASVTADIFRRFDAVLDSIGLMLHHDEERGYEFDGEDLIIERQDVSEELDQNRLDTLFHGGNRSWHEGFNQRRLSMPGASSPYRYLSSKGFDISEPGELILLPETSRVLALTNSLPSAPAHMVATEEHVYVAVGQPNVKRFSALDAADVVTQSTATETSEEVRDMATDGVVVFLALGDDGTHQSVAPGTTQEEAFDSGVWTNNGAGVTNAYDTGDKQEGTGSLKISVADTTGGNVEKGFGAAQDFSAVDSFKIWVKPNRAMVAGAVKLRLITSAGNYFERTLPALAQSTWYEDESSRTTDWTTGAGAPAWNNINSLAIVVPSITAPSFRSVTTHQHSNTDPGSEGISLDKPAGVVEGDLLLFSCAVTVDGTTDPAIVAPTGFTTIRDTVIASAGAALLTAYKVAGPAEPSGYSFSPGVVGAAWALTAVMAAYSGVDQANPINIDNSASDNTADDTIVTNTMTTTKGGCRIVGVYGYCQDTPTGAVPTATPPGGTTERADLAYDIFGANDDLAGIAVSDEIQASAGLVSARTTTLSENADRDMAHIIALSPAASPLTVKADDLRSIIVDDFAHWSDADARVVGWAKDRLYAAGIKTGTQWRFFQAASAAGSTEIFVLPDGWVVTDIVEQQGFVYFSAHRNTQGVIYVYDGTNAPFIALRLDPGITPLSLIPFSGAGLLIGCRRAGSGTGGVGILIRAFLTASGGLTSEPILEIGDDDSSDQGVRCGMQVFDEVYFGWPFADSTSSGLGVYFPDTIHKGAIARHIHGGVSSIPIDCVWFKGRRIFTLDGDGVYVEQLSKVATAQVVSSLIDVNIAADKLWLLQQSDFLLVTGAAIRHEYSADEGVTWSGFTEATSGSVLKSIIGVKSPRIQYRITATRGTTTTQGPKVFYTGIGGWPASKPGATHGLLVRAYPDLQLRSGEVQHDPDFGYTLFNDLETRRRNHDLLDYQPPWWPLSNTVLKVRVARVRLVGPWGLLGDNQGGLIYVQLKEAPPTT